MLLTRLHLIHALQELSCSDATHREIGILYRYVKGTLYLHQMNQSRSPMVAPRFASVGGGYDALLAPPIRQPRLAPPVDHRRCSSVTCSSTGSSYLERRGSAMVMPCLPPPPSFPRHAAYDEPWDLYYPIDIQVSRSIRGRNSSRGPVAWTWNLTLVGTASCSPLKTYSYRYSASDAIHFPPCSRIIIYYRNSIIDILIDIFGCWLALLAAPEQNNLLLKISLIFR